MATRPTYTQGGYYHFYNRGAHRESIFREPENYIFVLGKLKRYCRELALTPLAYCLMPNHYHFFIRQDGEQAARLLPQRVFNSYSKAYNKRYGHSGTMFEAHYKVIAVQTESYALNVCRYIHANPVKHGIVNRLEDWPYSNYLEWIGVRPGALVDHEFIRLYYPTPEDYREAMQDYLKERKELAALAHLEEL